MMVDSPLEKIKEVFSVASLVGLGLLLVSNASVFDKGRSVGSPKKFLFLAVIKLIGAKNLGVILLILGIMAVINLFQPEGKKTKVRRKRNDNGPPPHWWIKIPSLTVTAASVPSLIAQLRNPRVDRRLIAIKALGELGPEAESAIPHLIVSLEQDVPTRRVAARALNAVASQSEQAVPSLIELLHHENTMIRRQACDTLGNIGTAAAPALTALETQLRADNKYVRIAAKEAIENISL